MKNLIFLQLICVFIYFLLIEGSMTTRKYIRGSTMTKRLKSTDLASSICIFMSIYKSTFLYFLGKCVFHSQSEFIRTY